LHDVAAGIIEAAELAGIGVTVSFDDDQFPVTFASEAAGRIFGLSAEALKRQEPHNRLAPEDLPRVAELIQKRLRGEPTPRLLEVQALRADGTTVPIELGMAFVTIDGRPARVAFLHDISERKRAQQSEARYRTLIEHAADGVAILDAQHVIRYMNPSGLRMMGMEDAAQVVGRRVTEFVDPDVERRALARPPVAEGATEIVFRRPDGSSVVVETIAVPIEHDGKPAFMTFARDITERRQMEARLVQADRLAAVGMLAAGVAHEINNPLAFVLLNLGVLTRELPRLVKDPSRMEATLARVAETREGAERVATIVRDLRTFARSEPDRDEPVELRRVLESAVKMVSSGMRTRAHVSTLYETVPLVRGSEARLGQVFLNLLVNALQALPDHREQEVAVRLEHLNGEVVVTVSDTGAGIAPADLPRIFDPFFTTKPSGMGTGLGLSIVHSIVTSLGGRITVESTVGSGTRFRVHLPVMIPGPRPRARETPVPMPGSEGRLRVLIIDDEQTVAAAVARALEDENTVSVSTSAADALPDILAERYDVVICDVMMPRMGGVELYEEVAKARPGLERRIVFMTGAGFTPRLAELIDRTATTCLEKPFTGEAVKREVRKHQRGTP
jgi:PAS domain S-box-containing protein